MLRQVLAQVAAGHMIEPVAVVDAWTDNADTVCIVYTPPWGPGPLVGVRRVRGDTPSDPSEYAASVVDDITEPLGTTRLHRAANGFGWWGTVDGWDLLAWAER